VCGSLQDAQRPDHVEPERAGIGHNDRHECHTTRSRVRRSSSKSSRL
jgi:hypothetical protein